jgi:capsular polysaccharide transport system ATP-binding protein
MIELQNVTKRYPTRQGLSTVLDGVDLTVRPGEKLGILGRNGAGKSTLIRLLSGVEYPTSGRIQRDMRVSWPLAFTGGFQGTLTGADNLRFICRIYGVDYRPLQPFVEEFAELGKYFREPLKTYSAGMRARLAFALSMAIEFDCYLIDEVMAVGDARFQEKCQYELFEKRKDRAILMVSHAPDQIRAHCDSVYVLNEGRVIKFDDIDEAYERYMGQIGRQSATDSPVAATVAASDVH